MKENCNPNRTFFHGNLLKRSNKSSQDKSVEQKLSIKSEHKEDLYNDLLNLLFQKDREISKLDRKIQSMESELEQRQQDYANSLLAMRTKYDSKQEKWTLKLLEAQKLLHDYKVKAEEMQNLFQNDLASQNEYIEEVVTTLAEREEAHISEYNYLLKKLDEVIYIQNDPSSPVAQREVETNDTAKTQKQFEEITERSEDLSLCDNESKIPSEPQIIENFVTYSDQIKPCTGDGDSPVYAGTLEEEESPGEKTLRLEDSPRFEIATERSQSHREIPNSSPALARKKSKNPISLGARFLQFNTLRNNDMLFTQETIKDAIRSKQNLKQTRLSFVDQKMALKLVQRAKKSDLRASVPNVHAMRSTRGEDIQTTRASSVFSPKIISSRRGPDYAHESITTMPRDPSLVNLRQTMKIASIRAQIQAIIHNLNEQVSIFRRKPSVFIKTPRPLYLYRVLQCPARFSEIKKQKEESCHQFVLSPCKNKVDQESKTQRRCSKLQDDQKSKKQRISTNLLNSYRMQDQNNGDFLKLQISAILRDSSLSLTEKEMFVFSILNASLVKEDRQTAQISNSELLIRTPNQSLQLKSPLSNYTFSFKDSEHKGFFERLMAHHSLDSKGVFTIPENQKDFTTFSLNSFTSSFRVKTQVSRNSSSLDQDQFLVHSFNTKQPTAPKTNFESIEEQIQETDREHIKPEPFNAQISEQKFTEEDQVQSSERAILESKFYNDDTSPLYQNTGLDSVAEMIGNDPILDKLDGPLDREQVETPNSPMEFVSIIRPCLTSVKQGHSSSSTRSPEIMMTKQAFISKIPTIESIESESNDLDQVYYIQEEVQPAAETQFSQDEKQREENKSTQNQDGSFNFTFTPSDNNTFGCARSNPAISTTSIFGGRNYEVSSRNSCFTANGKFSKDRNSDALNHLQEIVTEGPLEFEPEQ